MLEIWICVVSILVAILVALTLITKKKEKEEDGGRPQVRDGGRGRRNQAAPHGARQRRGMRQMRRHQNNDDGSDDDWGGGGDERIPFGQGAYADPDDILDYVDMPEGKIGAKKMAKLEAKAEKRMMRERELEEREEKKKREEKMEAERRKEEAARAASEAAAEEEARKLKEEEERREEEEYLKLKEAFSVEEEGEAGVATEEEEQGLLIQFINHIQSQKVVLMEDLASHFSLRTQEAIQRVQDLQQMGRLTGVIDDRGKFIHISPGEMQEVAKFIRQHGRISISDLAAASASLIDLAPQTDLLTLET